MADLSVIIACVNGLPSIDECLSALKRQQGNFDAEIIVANRCSDETAEHIQRNFPGVKVLNFSEDVGIPQLRANAIAESKGRIIVVTEDHCIAPENWFQEIMKGHRSTGYMVVGGAVENGKTDRIIDWSVFLCEYSSAMLPIPGGEVRGVPGNNAAYKREAFDLVDDSIKRNYWEFFLHEELRKRGVKFLSVPSIVITHKKEFGFFYFLSQRFHYSRSFAGMRRGLIDPVNRLYYILASPLLPFLMLYRIARDVLFEKRRLYRQFILALPSLFVFMLSYAFGEFIGYVLGPGTSLSKVE